MDFKTEKKYFTFLLVLVGISISAFAENFPHRSGDQTTRLQQAIASNTDGIIKFDANKTYNFSRTLNIRKKIRFVGGQGTILKLNRTSNTGSFIICHANQISFRRLTLDASNKVNNAIVDINDRINVSFDRVTLRNALHRNSNTKGDGIGAYSGRACHGLKVNRCTFTNISHMAIKIINRDTDKYRANGPNRNRYTNGEIRRLLAPIVITNSTFNAGIDKIIEADCGNDDFVIDNRNDPRWVPQDARGGRRYTFTTDLAGSRIEGNTFKTHTAWVLGLIQASNITLKNNTMEGPANTNQRNNAIVHLEQVVRNVEISGNTMSLNSGVGNPSFISSSAREGRQRLRENPMVIAIRGRGGFTGNTGSNTVRGTDTCPPGSNTLTCKRDIHSYGPRNIYIFGNTFKANAKIKTVISFADGEGIGIGVDKNGNPDKNNYRQINVNRVDGSMISIRRGDLGNCDVTINEPDLTRNNRKHFNIRSDAKLNNNARCIQVNGRNAKQITTETEVNNTFSFGPNPASSVINITGATENTYDVSIYNLSGVLVKKISGIGSTSVAVNELNAGMYIIEYKNSNTSIIKRVVVE